MFLNSCVRIGLTSNFSVYFKNNIRHKYAFIITHWCASSNFFIFCIKNMFHSLQ